jgi:hypothetical protein
MLSSYDLFIEFILLLRVFVVQWIKKNRPPQKNVCAIKEQVFCPLSYF